MKSEKISVFQAVMILICFLIGTSVVLNPALESGEDAWLSALVGWGVGYLLALMTAALASLHPGKALVGILTDCFGRGAGRVLGLVFAALFIALSGVVLHSFGYYEITIEFPETPLLFIEICFLVIIVFTVAGGVEVIGRVSEVFLVVFATVVLVTLAAVFKNFHPMAFLPVLKNGVARPLTVGLENALLPFAEIMVALNIFPNLNDQKKIFRVVNRTVLVAGFFLFVIMARNIMVVGVELSSRNLFPAEKVFRLMPGVDIYPLLDLDVIMTAIIKVSLLLYAAVKTLGDVFGLRDFRVLTLPAAGLSVAFANLVIRSIYDQVRSAFVFYWLYLLLFVALPLVMLIVSLLRRGVAAPPDTARGGG